ncbi:hypothetical protein ILUMI_11661 [Ignelater luminosus]|uniref:Sphingomyelin phosphodiesterase C-terminal domain-containing protein n=1 Tax=Ignelater luminosus TaxID=2038154 RepID=A0A8K0CVM0_IGNLU|nr:hypothetical protein ILUMI_11661 [Ignelater luminosus]
MVEEWDYWLQSREALNTVRHGGFYSILLEHGLRVIVLNTNVCYTFNCFRWLLYKNVDLYRQLKWLTKELEKAEEQNEAVHLLGHAPPGDPECITAWAKQFQRIVERFANTIVAQFNGHTHFDEFRVFYNTSNISQAINVAWNGGSLTTYTDVNPNFRIYDIDPHTFKILDFTEWIFQIPVANLFPQRSPRWYKLYSFKKAYGLQSLELEEINKLVNRMTWDNHVCQQYHKFKIRDSEIGIANDCNAECIRNNLCLLATTVHNDNEKCNLLIQDRIHEYDYD